MSENPDLNVQDTEIFFYGHWQTENLIFFVNGGPGAESWTLFNRLKDELVVRKIGFVFFDQRGTGCSSNYPGVNDAGLPRWQHFGSSALAHDIESIRISIAREKKIKVFGHSFGAKVALRYGSLYPSSTDAVFILGDSFVKAGENLVNSSRDGLIRKKVFFEERVRKVDNLQTHLMSLQKKYKDSPCVNDPHGKLKICGYVLIRDLGHYYSQSSSETIETLVRHLDSNDVEEATSALSQLAHTYLARKLNAGNIMLFMLDYPLLQNGVHICELASANIHYPEWYFDSCAIEKKLAFFYRTIRFESNFVNFELMRRASQRPTPLKVIQFSASQDLSTSVDMNGNNLLPGWELKILPSADHYDFWKLNEFWMRLLANQ